MIERLGAQGKSHRRVTQQGCPVVFAPRSNSNPLRTPWRFEPRHVAVCIRFGLCCLPHSLPLRDYFGAALAPLLQVFFHLFLPYRADYLSYKIDPFLYWKVLHQNFHWPFFKRSTSPPVVALGTPVLDNVSQPLLED